MPGKSLPKDQATEAPLGSEGLEVLMWDDFKLKPNMVVHAYNLSTWEAESEGIRVQSLPGLCNKFRARLDCTETPCLVSNKNTCYCPS